MTDNKENILVQINYDYAGENHQEPFISEESAILFLKDMLGKRLKIIDENILGFQKNNAIKIFVELENCGSIKIFSNELEAIEYLTNIHRKRLELSVWN